MWYEIRVQLHSFAYRYPVVPAPFAKETIFPTLDSLGTLVKNINLKKNTHINLLEI